MSLSNLLTATEARALNELARRGILYEMELQLQNANAEIRAAVKHNKTSVVITDVTCVAEIEQTLQAKGYRVSRVPNKGWLGHSASSLQVSWQTPDASSDQ